VTAGQVNDPPAAEAAAHTPGDLPGLKQFLARQAAGATYGPSDGVEQGGSGKLRRWRSLSRYAKRGPKPLLSGCG